MMATLRRSLLDALDATTGIRTALATHAVPLRIWLLLLTLAGILPVMLFAGYTVITLERNAQKELLTELQTRTDDAARTIDQAIRKHVVTLSTLADNPNFETGDFEKIYNHAKRTVQSQPSIRLVSLVDQREQLLWMTAIPYGAPVPQTSELPSLRKAFKTGSPTLSRAFFGPFKGIPVFLVSVPVLRDGTASHVIRAAVRVDSLEKHLADLHLPEGWVAGIAEEGGRLIARSRLSQQFMDKPASPEFVAAIRRQEFVPFKATTVDGVTGTSAFAPILDGNWYLAIGVSDEVMLASLKATTTKLLVLGVLWLMIGLALSRCLSGYLSRQAKKLVREIHGPREKADPQGVAVSEFRQLMVDSLASHEEIANVQNELTAARSERDAVFHLYEQAPCGYHSLDANGLVLRMNQTELAWLGYNLGEVVGRTITDFMTPESQSKFKAHFPRFIAQGEISNLPFDFVRKDGMPFRVLLNATSVRDSAGKHVMSRSTLVPLYLAGQGPTLAHNSAGATGRAQHVTD